MFNILGGTSPGKYKHKDERESHDSVYGMREPSLFHLGETTQPETIITPGLYDSERKIKIHCAFGLVTPKIPTLEIQLLKFQHWRFICLT